MNQRNQIKRALCKTLIEALLLAVVARTTEHTEKAIHVAAEIAAHLDNYDDQAVRQCKLEASRILKARYN